MDYIDYDPVAEIYDLYAAATYDHEFFLNWNNWGQSKNSAWKNNWGQSKSLG